MEINCIILDDEPLALNLIEDYVLQTPFLKLCAKCSSPLEALEIVKSQQIDLAFLDIQMPLINGLELSKMLEGTAIIFTTAFNKYAVEGYKVNSVGYLLKPFSYSEFLEAANKGYQWCMMRRQAAMSVEAARGGEAVRGVEADLVSDVGEVSYLHKSQPSTIVLKSEYRQLVIDLSKILYIESMRDYQIFHLESGESIRTLMSLKSVETLLPKPDFVRVHRSFIVNIHKVKIIENSRILFGSVRVPISDSYRTEFEDRLKK